MIGPKTSGMLASDNAFASDDAKTMGVNGLEWIVLSEALGDIPYNQSHVMRIPHVSPEFLLSLSLICVTDCMYFVQSTESSMEHSISAATPRPHIHTLDAVRYLCTCNGPT